MEIEACGSNSAAVGDELWKKENDEVRVKRKALQAVLEKCQRALELLTDAGDLEEDGADSDSSKRAGEDESCEGSSSPCRDAETDELYDMIKSQVGGPEFLQKIEDAQASVYLNQPVFLEVLIDASLIRFINIKFGVAEDGSSWDMVDEHDLWEGEDLGSDQEDYVLVRQEDIVEGIACFMAAYLISLKQTKDLSPNKLQEALRRTFSVKKSKGKLRKAWDGSRVIYNVASWSATAIGIYQNPALLQAASTAFWTSCRVISKLL
ncbi:hypothetical protein V2J09_013874 [Rumex salicifolius]